MKQINVQQLTVNDELDICEIFYSIQGETSFVGRPAVFIRLAGCNLRCRWCDTVFARKSGKIKEISLILREICHYNCPLVVITGGEPLIQRNVYKLMKNLISEGYCVLFETNGSKDISSVPADVLIILDIKTPSSGETKKMNFSNMEKLKKIDEVKFVISDQNDFDWSLETLKKYPNDAAEILFSPAGGCISFEKLLEVVKKKIPSARVQANIHKIFEIK